MKIAKLKQNGVARQCHKESSHILMYIVEDDHRFDKPKSIQRPTNHASKTLMNA